MNNNRLDADELLHLAIHATHDGRHDMAISYLKQALEQSPDDPRMVYLLAAEHAQLGMFDRAMEGMAKAVALAPELYIARLQLGLLYLSFNRIEETLSVWSALDALADDEPLKLFKQGLEALIHEDYSTCDAKLQAGIQRNVDNPALNGDMARILSEMEQYRAIASAKSAEPAAESPAPGESDVNPLFLSVYQDSAAH